MAHPGNYNSLRTGNRTPRAGLVLAELGPKYKAIYQNTKQFRKSLESLVTPAHGQLSLLDVGRINEAVRWEVVSRIVLKLVADNPAMPPGEVVSSLNTVANATRNRNAIMAKLLNGKETNAASDPWAALLESPLAAHQDNASGANGRRAIHWTARKRVARRNARGHGFNRHRHRYRYPPRRILREILVLKFCFLVGANDRIFFRLLAAAQQTRNFFQRR